MSKHPDDVALERAREIIRGSWCTEAYARRADGSESSSIDPEAISFCALGSLRKVTMSEQDYPMQAFRYQRCSHRLSAAALELYKTDIVTVNDQLGKDAVLRCYDHCLQE